MLVIIEGIDGVGKSTLLSNINNFEISQLNPVFTKEPGSPLIPLNRTLREIVLTNKTISAFQRELLFYVDAQSHKKWIECQQNQLVISDRGLWSHMSYLYGTLKTKQMTYEEYILCKQIIKQTCAIPQAVIYLQGDIKLMEERLKGDKDAIESMGTAFYSYVLSQYDDLLLAGELEQLPILILDARDSIEENVNKSCKFLQELTVKN